MSLNPQSPQKQPRPNKLFYRIGEVSSLTGLEPYVLRYWETEFPQLKPDKGSSGQRLYKQKDVDHILRIKHLLYKEGFTIQGARNRLNGNEEQNLNAVLEAAKKDLKEILEILK